MSDTPPPTNEIAAELWRLGGQGASLGELLSAARDLSGSARIIAYKSFMDAFAVSLFDVRNIFENWEGWPGMESGSSSEELELKYGERVRAARRLQPRRTTWEKDPNGWGWNPASSD